MGKTISDIGKGVGKIDPLGKKVNTTLGLIKPDPPPPPQRDLTKEAQQALAAQAAAASEQYDEYAKYAPQYNQINTQMLGQSLFGSGFTGNLEDINSKFANNQQALLQQLNPGYYGAVNRYGAAQSDPNGYNAQLQQQSQDFLNLGGNLSPSELRTVQQASRGAFAARGMDASNASIADETLQTDAAYRQRLQENLGISTTLNQQANSNYLSGIGAQQGAFFDPSQYTQMLLGNTATSNLNQDQTTQNQFNPFNAYNADFFNTNLNATASARNSAANNDAAMMSGGAGLAGTALLVF